MTPASGGGGGSPGGLARLADLQPWRMQLGLESIEALLERLGCRRPPYPTVHVAGTNGKGSTAVYFAGLASASGRRVGLLTSPHLETPRERLRVEGVAIADEVLGYWVDRVLDAAGDARPTYFEALTAAALLWFQAEAVDLAVLEVGLGGRLDATNAVDGAMALITSISLDHTEWLGSTVGEIAREKAGVLRSGEPVVVAPDQSPAGLEVLDREIERIGAERMPLVEPPPQVRSPLPGSWQLSNLATAWTAAQLLPRLGGRPPTSKEAIGVLGTCRWPGRLESVEVPDTSIEIVLDGAHNVAGVSALVDWLEPEPYDLLFAVLRDKAVGTMLAKLAGRAGRVWLTEAPSPRTATVEELAGRLGGGPVESEADPLRALGRAISSLDRRGGGRLVVAGSLYLVGAVREDLRRRYGTPPSAVDLPIYEVGEGSG